MRTLLYFVAYGIKLASLGFLVFLVLVKYFLEVGRDVLAGQLVKFDGCCLVNEVELRNGDGFYQFITFVGRRNHLCALVLQLLEQLRSHEGRRRLKLTWHLVHWANVHGKHGV